MKNEGKAAIIAAALGLVARIGLARAAKFGGPAERERVAGDGFDAARFRSGLALRRSGRENEWCAALVGLSVGR